MRKGCQLVLILVTIIALIGNLLGCTRGAKHMTKIGISLPTSDLERWKQDGEYFKKRLESDLITVDLHHVEDNEVDTQISQIENMIADEVDVLIITAISGDSLAEVLEEVKDKGILLIAYDRLILGTDALSYYVTFNKAKAGVLQADYVIDVLNLDSGGGPYNIEFMRDDKGDTGTRYMNDLTWFGLESYFDNGILISTSVQEGRIVNNQVLDSEEARIRMAKLLLEVGYGPEGKRLDAVVCSDDVIAQGVSQALVDAGYTKENFPLVTGEDCEISSVKNIIAGTQSMSIYKGSHLLIDRISEMVEEELYGKGAYSFINDNESYHNGVKMVPSSLCNPVICTIDSYLELFLDSGYYTDDYLE